MEGIRIFLVGATLFAENVTQMLRTRDVVEQVEQFETLSAAILPIKNSPPDVLILADTDVTKLQDIIPYLLICPDITVICTDHQSTLMRLITTRLVHASLSDLIKSITKVKRITV